MIRVRAVLACAMFVGCMALLPGSPLRAQQAQEDDAQADDEPAETPAKGKKPASKTAAAGKHKIVISNGHNTALAILSVTPPGASETATVVLLRDLPPKAKKTVPLPGTACVFDVYGRFADDSTIGYLKMNLCKDRSINIVN